jgi:hypothetical protein
VQQIKWIEGAGWEGGDMGVMAHDVHRGIFVEQILKKARELNLADSEICVVSRLVLEPPKRKVGKGRTDQFRKGDD